jgi:hypothetical protein
MNNAAGIEEDSFVIDEPDIFIEPRIVIAKTDLGEANEESHHLV